jgi:hypothetical protein
MNAHIAAVNHGHGAKWEQSRIFMEFLAFVPPALDVTSASFLCVRVAMHLDWLVLLPVT